MNSYKLLMGLATIVIGYGAYGACTAYTGSPSIDITNNNDIASIELMNELNNITPSSSNMDNIDSCNEENMNKESKCINNDMNK